MQNNLTCQTRQAFSTRFWALLGFFAFAFSFGSCAQTFDLTVAKDGTGNYTTVQAAINAAPTGRTTPYRILIKNGTYTEKVAVPSSKPFLQLIGESVANTIITWNDGASTVVNGATVGTSGSYTFQSNANDFLAMNITFVNSFGDGSQAVAVSAGGDRVVFKNCRMLGNQDTLLTNSNGLQYYKNCYIDGNVDFIFGGNRAVFDNCVVYPKARTGGGSSYITAANTPAGQAFGYVFRNTILPANGSTLYSMGRPWQNSGTPNPNPANNKVVFLKSRVGFGLLQPTGWSVWDAGTNTSVITYAEFQSRYFNSNLVNTSQRLPWTQQLAPADTAQYTLANLFGTWNPCAVAANICTSFTPDIAVSNFRAVKSGTQTNLDWNISWAMTGIRYEVFRSTDNVNFTSFYNTTATNDSTYNFRTTDVLPAPGTAYYYYLRASKAGMATHQTATAVISSVPTITVTGNLGPFAQYLTGTSAVQTYTVSGVNLTGDITITAPANYEISPNGGTQWYSSATPVVLPQTNNAVAATTISVRLNATAAGTYTGNIVHTSAGAVAANMAVTGTKVNTVADPTLVLEQWALTTDAQPNITATGVVPTSPTFNGLTLSDNSTASGSIPGYSTTRGQAFAPLATGGGWTSGTLSRTLYEEFTVTAASTHTLRVDSLIFSSSFYNSANGVVGVSYSTTTPFPATPSEVTGGVLPPGGDYSVVPIAPVAQPAGATGAFATSATTATKVARRNNGPLINTNTYRLALNNTTGVTVAPGQTLTMRLYYALGSTSTPRQAFLLQVSAKGTSTSNAPCNAAFSYSAASYCANGTTNPQPTITGATGGTFSAGAGLSINATTGLVNLALSTPGTYTVTYNASSACSSTATVTITAPQTAGISYASASYCTSATAAAPVVLASGATAGTFSSSTGLTLNASTGAITPSTSTPGTYTVTNTLAASGGCAAATGTATVTITAPATAGFSYGSATYCASQTTAAAPTLAAGASAGTFSSTAGLTINPTTGAITPSTSTAGTYTVTNTVTASGGCAAATSTFTVTITAPASAGFSYGAASYCTSLSTAATPTLSTGASAGTFSSASGLTVNASTGAITPSTSTAGTYTVTNTVAAAGGCAAATATFTVTITAAPTASFTYPAAAYCRTATGTVAATPGTGSTAGTFSSTTGLTINATTGAITPSTSTAGTYVVTNTVAAAGGCAAVTSIFSITINATPTAPTVTATYNGTVTTLTSSATTGNQWYLNGQLIPGATGQTYVVNGTGAAQLGSYTVVTTSAQGCASVASAPLVVTASRNALAGTSLNVYPNPTTNGTLTIELLGYHQQVTLTLLNTLGQQVLTRVVAGNATPTLELNGLAAGVYLLRATTAGGSDTRRIVVGR